MQSFIKVCSVSDIPDSGLFSVELENTKLLVINTRIGYVVLNSTCPHRGADLSKGQRIEDTVICPWHRTYISLEDGHIEKGPEITAVGIINDSVKILLKRVVKYETKIEGGSLFIKRPIIKQRVLFSK